MTKPYILVATDFSSRADRAIDRALQLGRDTKQPIRFVYAMEAAKKNAPTMEELNWRMEQCVGYPAGTDQGGGPIEYLYPEGSPPVAIAEACENSDAGMLLIGPARYNSFGDFFLGTAVDYVLRHTTKPVLIVKKRTREAYKQIVAGTDFSRGSAHAIIEAARMFPEASVHITHAWHVPFEGFQRDGYVADETQGIDAKRLEEFVQKLAEHEPRLAEATTSLVRGGAYDAVREALKMYPDALVALGSHGETGFRKATLGSNTSDMLRFLDSDILVVNTKGAAN
ncbi:MAG: universal stress protein [Erythrobacter sp.]|uniref:universal stress protein n=1 Tax=Erythrobacter sp. TaxID=1042 RepID=UPI0026360BDB|nr:universal stress protein [Erythrobacter sp.]MDJ0977331.1 universal stress protein [Erythrobacter sp.]